MSVKDYFSFASIKRAVLEFLKARTDFAQLKHHYRTPFRAFINHHGAEAEEFFISDSFSSIKCEFSDACLQSLAQRYPSSVRVSRLGGMLIYVERWRLKYLRSHQSSTYSVVLEVEEMRVVSFDRFPMKLPASVMYDDHVRLYLRFNRQNKTKQDLVACEFELPLIEWLPTKAAVAVVAAPVV